MTSEFALIYVEIDTRYCANVYGTAPCTAAGSEKCYNTRNQRADCQDPVNFTDSIKTYRFGLRDCGFLPSSIPCIPLLKSATVKGAYINPGEDIGERATISATFHNGQHSDTGIDKYVLERDYIAFETGTFWGKFRARNTYLEGQAIRIYRGYLGQTLDEMDCEHFLIDSMEGPNSDGGVVIKGADFLKQFNSKRALAPFTNSGYIAADVAAGASSVTLSPVGIGDDEYDTSGRVAFGEEVLDFTRVGDVLTFGSNTTEDHDEGEVLQQTLRYVEKDAAFILDDLSTNYTPLGPGYTDLAAWQALLASFANILYTREIVRPTPVRTLANELINQAGLIVNANTRTRLIDFDVIRPNPSTGPLLSDVQIMPGSFQQADQPDKRYSAVIVHFGKRDVFADNNPKNFYSATIEVAEDSQYEVPVVKRIYSEWIPAAALSAANDVAARAIARYKFPPLKLASTLFGPETRRLGQVVPFTHPRTELPSGLPATFDAVVVSVSDDVDKHSLILEEYNIAAGDFAGAKIIQYDFTAYSINLREEYDKRYTVVDEGTDAPDIIFVINADAGATSTSSFSVESGDWPAGVEPLLVINPGKYLVGAGGVPVAGGDGGDGGGALRVTSPIRVQNLNIIGGGGGAGGGTRVDLAGSSNPIYPGAPGAGLVRAAPGAQATAATITTGGTSNSAGNGGDLGQSGTVSGGGPVTSYAPGSAGVAVTGDSLITWVDEGTILGARIG